MSLGNKRGKEDKEKKLAAPPLFAPARIGAPPASSFSFWDVLGLNALLATKTGTLAFLLLGTSAAGGVTYYLLGERAPRPPAMEAPQSAPAGAPSLDERGGSSGNRPRAGSSLDYLSKAESGSADPIRPQEPTPEAAESDRVSQAPASLPENASGARESRAGKLLASKFESKTPAPIPAFKPMGSGSPGSGFQPIYKPAAPRGSSLAARPSYGASRRSAVIAASSSKGALQKIASSSRQAARAVAAGRSESGGAYGSAGLDTAQSAQGAIEPGGVASGEAGPLEGPTEAEPYKETPSTQAPETPKGKNKTPYQNLVFAAIGALMVGLVLLLAAGSSKGPQTQMLAMAAAAAGGVAAAIGALIATQYGQALQGLPFIAGGGVLAFQAMRVMAKGQKAAQDAKCGIEQNADKAAADVRTAMEDTVE